MKYLHGHVYNVFCESTCFGKYMQMHQCRARGKIHRCCMALELNCSSRQAFVMRVNGSTLRFTLREFALISGLNCVNEETDFIFDQSEPNSFMEKYFEGVKLIRKIDIMRSFHRNVRGVGGGENDHDGLKFAILYFIQTVIFSGERSTKKVPRLYFDLVESGRYTQFPWGKKAFYLLIKSLSKKLNGKKQFYRIGGMPIVFQVWLFECSSSNDFQVAQKVDDHIPRLLNWQTTNESRRYKKLMNTIFSDVNNKIKFRNITPNQRELAVLQLPPEGIENQAPPQYSDSSDDEIDDEIIDTDDDQREGSCDDKDSEDDFQAPPPPQAVKVKRKENVGSSTSPLRKRTKKLVTGGSKQDAKKLEPRIALKQLRKKNAEPKKRTSGLEVEGWVKELSDFRKEVKQEFVEIRNLINDNFKTVLADINSKQNEQEAEHSDDHVVPPKSNDEDGYTQPFTFNKESPTNQVLVSQCDKLKSENSETLKDSNDSKSTNVVSPTINNTDGIYPTSDDHEVNQPSFVFDIPPQKVLGVSEKSHEDDVEQMPCPVPIQILDHMKVTTDSQFELDDQFMPSLNSIKSSIAPHSTVIKGHTEQLPTTIAGCITTKADQSTIDVQLGMNG
nr:uncharacterized protein LOC101268625 isoform X2 [Solanum lycopersicum]